MYDRRAVETASIFNIKNFSELDSTDICRCYQYEQSNRSQKMANIKITG